jgi:predicted O-methyltransferase YrrM
MDSSSSLDKPPQAASDAEQRILSVADDMSQGEWYANVSPTDGRFLRQLTEAVGAKRVVEIGTSSGYSGLWFALALRTTGGHLWTHELDSKRAEMARNNFKKAGVDDLITVIEGDAHKTVSQHNEPIDVLFLDADKPGYVDYLEKLLPLVRPGGLILAHNMRQPEPDSRYIEAITTNPQLETTFVLMNGAGIGVTLKKRDAK